VLQLLRNHFTASFVPNWRMQCNADAGDCNIVSRLCRLGTTGTPIGKHVLLIIVHSMMQGKPEQPAVEAPAWRMQQN